MRTRPEDYPKVFGRNFAKRNGGAIVQIGDQAYDRYRLGAIGCPHTTSARVLDRALRELKVASVKDLVETMSPEDFVEIKGFRVTAFYALTCILRDQKVNLRTFYRSKVTIETMASHVKGRNKKRRSK